MPTNVMRFALILSQGTLTFSLSNMNRNIELLLNLYFTVSIDRINRQCCHMINKKF